MSRPASGQKDQLLSLDWIVTIGKHKGETLEDVINSDPGWVRWASHEIAWFNLDNKASRLLELQPDTSLDWDDFM